MSASQDANSPSRHLKRPSRLHQLLPSQKDTTPFILDTDASASAAGAVLSQQQDGHERVIAYYSKVFTKPERNYCTTRRELLAIIKAITHFHHYLLGRKFIIRTDHASLTWLLSFKTPDSQVARWLERLHQYNFDIQHRPGSLHTNADGLSRRPCGEKSCKQCTSIEKRSCISLKTIPCGNEMWTPESLRAAQLDDPDIGLLIQWKTKNRRPQGKEVSSLSPTLKGYLVQWDSLYLRDNVLYGRWESAAGGSVVW